MDAQIDTRKQHQQRGDNSERRQDHGGPEAGARFFAASGARHIAEQYPLDTQSRNEPQHPENVKEQDS